MNDSADHEAPCDGEAELDAVAAALDWTLVEVRRSASATPPRPIPPRLAPLLRFRRFPTRARRLLRDALDDDEFRARVAIAAEHDDLDRVNWLVLHRPDGWESEYRDLIDASAPPPAKPVGRDRTVRELQQRLDKLTRDHDALQADHVLLTGALQAAEADLVAARDEISSIRSEVDSARRARRELTEQKRVTARLGAELKEVRERHAAEVPRPSDQEAPGIVERLVVREVVPSSLVAWFEQGRELFGAVDGRAAEGPAADRPTADRAGGDRSGSVAGRKSRAARPRVQPGRGRRLDAADGLRVVLDTPGVVALLDGYNVAKLLWPRLSLPEQRRALIDAVGSTVPPKGADVVVVFDGDELVTAPRSGPRHVAVRFTAKGHEADDEILAMIETIPVVRPILVVSSDRRVQRGAQERGADVVSSSAIGRLLLP